MSVTAQEFRDAAAEAGRRQQAIFYRGDSLADPWLTTVQACLLCAAEQAEQLERLVTARSIQDRAARTIVKAADRRVLKAQAHEPAARIAIATLESERDMNARLTEEVDRVTASLVQVKREKDQRIVELIQQSEGMREQIAALTARVAELEADHTEARMRVWEMRDYLAGNRDMSEEMKAFWHGRNTGPGEPLEAKAAK